MKLSPVERADRQTGRYTEGRTEMLEKANNRFSQFCERA